MIHPRKALPPLAGILAIFVLAFCLISTSCNTTGSSAANENVLRVGVAANAAPIIYKSGGNITGLEAEFAHAVAAKLGKSVQFVNMPFEKLIPSLSNGKIDVIMSGLTVTATRKPLLDYTLPYMVSGQGVMTRSEKAFTYEYPQIVYSIQDTMGVEKGSIGDILVQRGAPQAIRKTYSSADQGARALLNKEINVFIHDLPILWHTAARYETRGLVTIPKRLTQEELAWAVQRGNTPLRNQLNAILQQWQNDGTLNRMISRYMPKYYLIPRL